VKENPPCKKKYKVEWSYNTIRTFPDCSDTTTYIDSAYWQNDLSYVKYINSKVGVYEYSQDFDKNGNPKTFYRKITKGVKKSTFRLSNDGRIYLTEDFIKINDTLIFNYTYFKNGLVAEKGARLGRGDYYENYQRFGQWEIFDSTGTYKEVGMFNTNLSPDTIEVVDIDNIGKSIKKIVIVDGIRIGVWKKYDLEGRLLSEEIY
jgi:antitoxin component YwqK of YwqJK toxin-antitoxin module